MNAKHNFPTPKVNEPSQRAAEFFKAICNFPRLSYLVNRWLDERQYEDILDYKKQFEPLADNYGVQITKMSKRPFGFDFLADGRTFSFRIKSNGSASFLRIS